MSHPIPEDAQRLARRLRLAAEEIESAARYGVPIPTQVIVNGYEVLPGCTFHATEEEFAAWASYTEATVEEYVNDGTAWSTALAEANGLTIKFATAHRPAQ